MIYKDNYFFVGGPLILFLYLYMINFRVGNGYDVHALGVGVPLILGGVKVEHNKGCIAHSDGDVVIHSLCDALLGALALGDIGQLFPDNSPTYKGIDSRILLSRVMELVKMQGYKVGNVDIVIAMQQPKLSDRIPLMRQTLASLMWIDDTNVSIKATTTEKLGFVGREEGVEVYSTVLVYKE